MRILHISFRNLNSLVGDWSIDLTHPAFVSDGVFAITGPTGAGKSTILDAICLALYGRTPRLERVNKSTNEIMSRQTGECAAEVTFETGAGRFRCHFSQRRARKKPDGALQEPVHEFVDLRAQDAIENRRKDVARRVEEVTGMDFDRFTRSMLLAQGGFAAFLEARADERSPILEQITGTAVYSAISMEVHGRFAEEKRKLEALSEGLRHIRLLDPEALASCGALLAEKALEEERLTREQEAGILGLNWRKRLADLEEDLKGTGLAREALALRREAFLPEEERLQKAQQALELAADHAGLAALRREEARDADAASRCRERLPEHEKTLAAADALLQEALRGVAEKREAIRTGQPLLREVRALDLRLREKEGPLAAERKGLLALEAHQEALERERVRTEGEMAAARRRLTDVAGFLAERAVDGALVTELTGFLARMETLQDLTGEREKTRIAAARAAAEVREAEKRCAACVWDLESAAEKAGALQADLEKKRVVFSDLLGERSLDGWRRECWGLREEMGLLEALEKQAGLLAEAEAAFLDTAAEEDRLRREKAEIACRLAAACGRREALEREAELLEVQLTLHRKIQDLEEARNALREGEPCPLCGATVHPFAEDSPPLPDAAREALGLIRREMKATASLVAALGVQEAERRKDLERLDLHRRETMRRKAEAERESVRIRDALGFSSAVEMACGALAALRVEKAGLAEDAGKRVAEGEILEKEIRRFEVALESFAVSARDAERKMQEATHRRDVAIAAGLRAQEDAALCARRQEEVLGGLQKALAPHGLVVDPSRLEGLGRELMARKKTWCDHEKQQEALNRELHTLEIRWRHLKSEAEKNQGALFEKKETLSRMSGERADLVSERQRLFGQGDPDREEARMAEALAAAEEVLVLARRRTEGAGLALDRLVRELARLEGLMEERARPLAEAEAAFSLRLAGLGFGGEEAFLQACMEEDLRKDILFRMEALRREEAGLAERERDRRRVLDMERKRALTEEDAPGLAGKLAGLEAARAEVRQEMGGLRQQLLEDARQRERFAGAAEAVEAQKAVCARWSDLHVLIGSADGKKYRNFAQGLTFEVMVGHANRQLRKMTDRYLLVRDTRQPLELNVVDGYQAGEIRSTRNLSGGERFIVSLALALGLSRMVSRRVRVASLFLDEGFGALDEDTLDMALETLSGLQRDGRLIGVISHVPGIRDRMGTRIQVKPEPGGRSVLRGPGCGRRMDG